MRMKKAIGTAFLAVLLIVSGGCGREAQEFISSTCSGSEAAARTDIQDEDSGEGEALDAGTPLEESICVYVCGEVISPGVYTLHEGARAYEAVDAAGGMTWEADGEAVNLARILRDGEQVTVPAIGQPAGKTGGKVNINTADPETLMTLSGVGQSKAEAIIAYREEYGPYGAVEDIMNVNGIGSSMFERIKDDITVG